MGSGPAAPLDTIRKIVNTANIYMKSEFCGPDMIVRFGRFVKRVVR